ncbi:MAG: dihydropteroate synthase, partial [Clostridia bacterium]|nr:dihydropteroate synthase [Clostridia bacterium]
PNAGLPRDVGGETVFDVKEEEFASDVALLMKEGVRAVGGCCGTTPDYIKTLFDKIKDLKPIPVTPKNITVVSSYARAVTFDKKPLLIGERINPTGKKRFKQALLENDVDYILREGVTEEEKGVHLLDVNVGLPDVDECEMLPRIITELQGVTSLPLVIDTSNFDAMEKALRRYNGKPMLNSLSGKEESMERVFPLIKKYGAVAVALTLDENGIPETAEGRVEIAKKILERASEYGVDKKDIVFDTLTLTVSADPTAPSVTLGALDRIKKELGSHTVLGVSNVSFGLPERDAVNSAFFTLALSRGLSSAIMNPYSSEMMKAYYTFLLLSGADEGCSDYLENAHRFHTDTTCVSVEVKQNSFDSECQEAIIRGYKERAGEIVTELLKTKEPLEIVNSEIIPALNRVGEGFEKKTLFLPSLITSAECAKRAFDVIKDYTAEKGVKSEKKATFVIATVKGDIHDIGKNIVKLLLENYGYEVIDLGKDVPPERILSEVVERKASFVGLSALMTTTVPAMEETVKLIKENAPWCKTVVGGAVGPHGGQGFGAVNTVIAAGGDEIVGGNAGFRLKQHGTLLLCKGK